MKRTYGVLLPAMGLGLVGVVWAYALVFFVIIDFLKVRFYRLTDHEGIIFSR